MRVCEGFLKRRVVDGEIMLGGQILDSRSSAVLEIYKDVGFDFVLIDREHTALTEETISDHVRVARCLGLPCMVRAADDSYHELNRTLDQAPDGIFIPRITTAEHAARVIRTVKYAPEGTRGICGSSAPIGKYRGWKSLKEQRDVLNRNTVVGLQIETREAMEDLEEILGLPGVDIALVGNDDLTLNMGIPGASTDPDYVRQVEGVIDSCARHGVLPGIAVGDPSSVAFWVERGMKFFWYSSDILLLHWACDHQLREVKRLIKPKVTCR